MRIEDFLEKKEGLQIAILKKLVLENGKISYEDLRNYLGISKASLESYLEELESYLSEYQGDCRVKSDGSKIELFFINHFSIVTVYTDYVKRSLKFQLIDYAFKHQKFTAVKITNDLSISESSLFRKIKESNDLLKEFNIQIKNGSLHGEELQIRYFYFQLYWLVTPNEKFQETVLPAQIHNLINGFEKELDIKISDFSRIRVHLWFAISKKRANISEKIYKNSQKKLKLYENDRLYKQVRQLILLYFSRYSIEVGEEESMLHFIFLTTQSILSEKDFINYDLIRSRRTPTALVDTLLRETVLHYYLPVKPSLALERKISYYLSQINGTLYFFEGALEIYDREDFLAQESKVWRKNLKNLSEELLTTALANFNQKATSLNTLQGLTLLEYSSVLSIVDFKISKELHIGIDLNLMEMHTEILTQMLELNLKNVTGITVEEYKKQRNYDLVITNNLAFSEYPKGTEIYVTSDFFSSYDLKQIKSRINELKI